MDKTIPTKKESVATASGEANNGPQSKKITLNFSKKNQEEKINKNEQKQKLNKFISKSKEKENSKLTKNLHLKNNKKVVEKNNDRKQSKSPINHNAIKNENKNDKERSKTPINKIKDLNKNVQKPSQIQTVKNAKGHFGNTFFHLYNQMKLLLDNFEKEINVKKNYVILYDELNIITKTDYANNEISNYKFWMLFIQYLFEKGKITTSDQLIKCCRNALKVIPNNEKKLFTNFFINKMKEKFQINKTDEEYSMLLNETSIEKINNSKIVEKSSDKNKKNIKNSKKYLNNFVNISS